MAKRGLFSSIEYCEIDKNDVVYTIAHTKILVDAFLIRRDVSAYFIASYEKTGVRRHKLSRRALSIGKLTLPSILR